MKNPVATLFVVLSLALGVSACRAQSAPACAMPTNPTAIQYGLITEGAYAYWYCDPAMKLFEYRIATFAYLANKTDTLDAFSRCLKNDCKDAAVLNAGTPRLPSTLTDPDLQKVQRAVMQTANKYRSTLLATYVVAKNGTSTTRPAFDYDGTTRATLSKYRATVGAACACNLEIFAEGKTTYCSVNGLLTQVAACAKPQ